MENDTQLKPSHIKIIILALFKSGISSSINKDVITRTNINLPIANVCSRNIKMLEEYLYTMVLIRVLHRYKINKIDKIE